MHNMLSSPVITDTLLATTHSHFIGPCGCVWIESVFVGFTLGPLRPLFAAFFHRQTHAEIKNSAVSIKLSDLLLACTFLEEHTLLKHRALFYLTRIFSSVF